jgi:hypothetical protein
MSAQNFQNYGFGSSNFLLSEDLESRTAAPAPGVKPRRSSIYAGAERIPMKIKKQPEEDDEEVKYMQKLQASMSGYFKNKQPPAVQVFYSTSFYSRHLNSMILSSFRSLLELQRGQAILCPTLLERIPSIRLVLLVWHSFY